MPRKLLHAEPGHSRFRSARGEALPLRAWPRATRSVVRRAFRRGYPDTPWMAPSAVAALDTELHSGDRLLELGSGRSTAWYGKRAAMVISVEPVAQWAAQVKLWARQLDNVEVVEEGLEPALQRLVKAKEHFDIVIVDFDEEGSFSRVDGLRYACLLGPRLVVLDDSDRPEYRGAIEVMEGWKACRYLGVKYAPVAVVETTIFRREELDSGL